LVRPALLRWQGAKIVSLPTHTAILGESISNSGDRRHFVRVRTGADGKIFSSGKQVSHSLSSLAAAEGLLDVPPRTTFTDGSRVDVLRCV
jgi:molybdopterin molybdotransferase